MSSPSVSAMHTFENRLVFQLSSTENIADHYNTCDASWTNMTLNMITTTTKTSDWKSSVTSSNFFNEFPLDNDITAAYTANVCKAFNGEGSGVINSEGLSTISITDFKGDKTTIKKSYYDQYGDDSPHVFEEYFVPTLGDDQHSRIESWGTVNNCNFREFIRVLETPDATNITDIKICNGNHIHHQNYNSKTQGQTTRTTESAPGKRTVVDFVDSYADEYKFVSDHETGVRTFFTPDKLEKSLRPDGMVVYEWEKDASPIARKYKTEADASNYWDSKDETSSWDQVLYQEMENWRSNAYNFLNQLDQDIFNSESGSDGYILNLIARKSASYDASNINSASFELYKMMTTYSGVRLTDSWEATVTVTGGGQKTRTRQGHLHEITAVNQCKINETPLFAEQKYDYTGPPAVDLSDAANIGKVIVCPGAEVKWVNVKAEVSSCVSEDTVKFDDPNQNKLSEHMNINHMKEWWPSAWSRWMRDFLDGGGYRIMTPIRAMIQTEFTFPDMRVETVDWSEKCTKNMDMNELEFWFKSRNTDVTEYNYLAMAQNYNWENLDTYRIMNKLAEVSAADDLKDHCFKEIYSGTSTIGQWTAIDHFVNPDDLQFRLLPHQMTPALTHVMKLWNRHFNAEKEKNWIHDGISETESVDCRKNVSVTENNFCGKLDAFTFFCDAGSKCNTNKLRLGLNGFNLMTNVFQVFAGNVGLPLAESPQSISTVLGSSTNDLKNQQTFNHQSAHPLLAKKLFALLETEGEQYLVDNNITVRVHDQEIKDILEAGTSARAKAQAAFDSADVDQNGNLCIQEFLNS